jgi:LacI family transcriptional regulator
MRLQEVVDLQEKRSASYCGEDSRNHFRKCAWMSDVETDGRRGKAPGRATIRDVARHAGVSVATVSRVLNGRPDVAPETRDAVVRAIRTYNFTTNRSARALSVGRTGLVGVTIPHVRAEYFASILSGATEALYEQDMRVVLCPTLHEHDREVRLVDRLMRGATDGAILLLPSESSDELKELQRYGSPFVVADPREPLNGGIPAVTAAHWAGAKEATDHLVSLGHRRIAAITGPRGWLATEERLDGYRASLAEAGVLPEAGLVVDGDFLIESGYAGACALLDLPEPPTAIFAFNDGMAVGAWRAARERGVRIPSDLSLVGFDDSEVSRMVMPSLTTVRQPLEELGRMAVSLLMRLVDGLRVEALTVKLETKLVVRASTAPPRD